MKEIYKIIGIWVMLCLSSSLWASENFVKNKQYKYVMKYQKGMYLDVSNQYGDVEIIATTNDSIKIVAEVEVNSKKEENLATTLKNILVEFKSGVGYAIAETRWSGDVDFFTKNYQNVKAGVINEDAIVVNYKVYVPKYMELNIKNKFGNILMESHTGRLSIELAHGDFRARDLENVRQIDVKFGKLKVNKVGDTRINLTSVKYAEIASANSISLKSTSSDIEINTVESLVIDSKHDVIQIENLGEITGDASLSDIKIQNLNNSLRLVCKFGSMRIQNSKESVTRIDVTASRTDLAIAFGEGATASIELTLDDKKYLYANPIVKKITETPAADAGTRFKLLVGSTSKTLVNIQSEKGYVELGK